MTITESAKVAVLALHLKGETRDGIASLTGLSAGTVSSILSDFNKTLGPDLSASLGKFCKIAKKSVSPEAALIGYHIGVMMHGLGLDVPKTEGQLKALTGLLKKGEAVSVSKVLRAVSSVLERNPNIPIEDLPAKVDKLAQDHRDLTAKNLSLREQNRASNDALSRTLENNRVTLKEMQEYKQARTSLASQGLDIANMPRFARVMAEMQAANYSDMSIIAKCDHNDSLTRRNSILERENSDKELEKKRLTSSLHQVESQLSIRRHEHAALFEVNQLGFGVDELRIISESLEPVVREIPADRKSVLRKMLLDLKENFFGFAYFEERLRQTRLLNREAVNDFRSAKDKIAEEEKQLDILRQRYEEEYAGFQNKMQKMREETTKLGSCWEELIRRSIDRQILNPIGPLHKEVPYWLVDSIMRYWLDSEQKLIKITPLILCRLGYEVPIKDLLGAYLDESSMIGRLMPLTQESMAIGQMMAQLGQSWLQLR